MKFQISILLAIILAISCKRQLNDVSDYTPKLEVVSHYYSSTGFLVAEAEISDFGPSEVVKVGFWISTSPNIDRSNPIFCQLNGNSFQLVVSSFQTNRNTLRLPILNSRTYYVQAFATNDLAYGVSEVYTVSPIELEAPPDECVIDQNSIIIDNDVYGVTLSGPFSSSTWWNGVRYELTYPGGSLRVNFSTPLTYEYYYISDELENFDTTGYPMASIYSVNDEGYADSYYPIRVTHLNDGSHQVEICSAIGDEFEITTNFIIP